MTIPDAIQAFGIGYVTTRSFTQPYELRCILGVWVMRDAARTKGTYRTEEWVIHNADPQQAVETVRSHVRGNHFLCVIDSVHAPLDETKSAYKMRGYRLHRREPLMIRNHPVLQHDPAVLPVRRVSTTREADALKAVVGIRMLLPIHIEGSDVGRRPNAGLPPKRFARERAWRAAVFKTGLRADRHATALHTGENQVSSNCSAQRA